MPILVAFRCHTGVTCAAIGDVRLAAGRADIAGLGRAALVVRALGVNTVVTRWAIRDVLLAASCTYVACL